MSLPELLSKVPAARMREREELLRDGGPGTSRGCRDGQDDDCNGAHGVGDRQSPSLKRNATHFRVPTTAASSPGTFGAPVTRRHFRGGLGWPTRSAQKNGASPPRRGAGGVGGRVGRVTEAREARGPI